MAQNKLVGWGNGPGLLDTGNTDALSLDDRRLAFSMGLLGFGSGLLEGATPSIGTPRPSGLGLGASRFAQNYTSALSSAVSDKLMVAKIAESKARAASDLAARQSVFGQYHPMAGGKPWVNPDTNETSYGGGAIETVQDPAERSRLEAMAITNPTAFGKALVPEHPQGQSPAGKLAADYMRGLIDRGEYEKQLAELRSGRSVPTALERNTAHLARTLGVPESEAVAMLTDAKDKGPDQFAQNVYLRALASNLGDHNRAMQTASQALGAFYPGETFRLPPPAHPQSPKGFLERAINSAGLGKTTAAAPGAVSIPIPPADGASVAPQDAGPEAIPMVRGRVDRANLRQGAVYQSPHGVVRWNGAAFEAVR